MALGNDFASKRGFPGDIDMSIVLEESSLMGDPSFMIQGHSNTFVSQFFLSCKFFNSLVNFVGHRQDESVEMRSLKDNNVIIVFFALVMVIMLG